MQSTQKLTGNYLICTHLRSQNHLIKSLNVAHLKARQVFQKEVILKKTEGGGWSY